LQGRATLTRVNPDADEIVDHLLALGLPSIVARPAVGAEGGLGLDEAGAARVVAGYERLAGRCLAAATDAEAARRAAPFLGYFGKLLEGRPRRVPCQQQAWTVACAADGALYPCKDMAAKPQYQIGTVWSGIDWSKAYDEASGKLLCQQQAAKKAECATCWGRELCQISCMHVCLEPKERQPDDGPRYSGWECSVSLGVIEIALDLFERLRQERPAVFWQLCCGETRDTGAGLLANLLG
jgi:radical SAM protein with 4Fe4S-binding SPASM domain